MKLNKDHFSFGTVIIHFWDKPYQETNFKDYLNGAHLCKQRKNVLFIFISLYLFVLTFAMKLKYANYKSHWNILVFYEQWKMMSDLNMSQEKISDFISFPLFGFMVVIVTLIFFDEKERASNLNIFHGKNVRFCLISIAWFHFCHKTEKFWFWKSLKFWLKKWCRTWLCPVK